MNIRFTPGFLYCTNAPRSPLFVDEKVRLPYWMRSRMRRSEPRMMSRTRRIAASDGGCVFANQRSTAGDFGNAAMLRTGCGFTSAGQRQGRRVSAALACVTGTERIENAYERRIRIASEVATW